VAVESGGVSLSYRELLERARAAALDVTPGDRVAVALPAGVDFVVAVWAVLLRGGVVVPVDLRLSDEEQAARLAGARLVVREPLGVSDLPHPVWKTHLDAPLAVLHTSGTTAAPKPVELTWGNFQASALGSAVALGLDRAERWLCPMPLVHVGGLSVALRSAIYATTAVLHERFDTERVLAELGDPGRGITLVSLVPTMLARLLDAGLRQPPTLRWALLGGGPIAPALLERAAAAGVPVAPTYGMTEATSQIATFGWPLPGTEVRLDPTGEILVRGATVAPGALAGDGWLHTADLGLLDSDGRLEITGRAAETIVTGGENVAPAEVEAVLLEHPAVADAGVYARPDEQWGEAVVAAIVARPGEPADPEAIRAHCAARLAGYKVPKEIRLVDGLPRTASGKLLRRELAA
jgi:O-succinylbenzoic acid--CoA ligase